MMTHERLAKGRHEKPGAADLARGQTFAIGSRIFAIPATAPLGEIGVRMMRESVGSIVEVEFTVNGFVIELEEL